VLTHKRIGVFMGGISAEREISLKSGTAIYRALMSLGYNVASIDVGHDICRVLKNERVNIAFLALHGGYGENGSIQGMLEVLGIPYTGSGVLSSALAMNKEASKKIFLYHNIPVPPFAVIQYTSSQMPELLAINFPLPWVVKPVAEGSSVGVGIVRNEEDVLLAFEKALKRYLLTGGTGDPIYANPKYILKNLSNYTIEYSGVVMDGKKIIYCQMILDFDEMYPEYVGISEASEFSTIFDSGCDIVNVWYDPEDRKITELWCNGVA